MLTLSQKRQFVDQGFLHVPGVVPRGMIDAALNAINHSIGNVGKTGGDKAKFLEDSFCFELKGEALMTDVFNRTDVKPLVEDLMGEDSMLPVESVQIAPRFPMPLGERPPESLGHLDGIGGGKNGSAKGSYARRFAIFAVVYLVDVIEPNSGNFTVWPHSHVEFERHFKNVGHEIMADGVPQIKHSREKVMVTGRAGDLILAHHQIQHEGGHNLSPNVRHALISRIRSHRTEEIGNNAYTDIWREWEGLAGLIPGAA